MLYRFELARSAAMLIATCALVSITASPSWAAPTIGNISPRGLQVGGTTTLVIDGSDLPAQPQILLPVPIAKQTVKPGNNANHAEIEVQLADGIASSIEHLRLAGANGVSNAVLIGLDRLRQIPFAAEAGSLPVALHGQLQGAGVLRASFAGKKGEPLVVEVEGRRLGSAVNPVVHLYDARNVQLAWAQGSPQLAGDARLFVTLPADGRYTVELHDMLYRGPEPSFFRLKMGALQFAELPFPLAVSRGVKSPVELVGGTLTTTIEVTSDARLGSIPIPLPADAAARSTPPRLLVTSINEVREEPKPAQIQSVAAPVGINGRLSAPGEHDKYRVTVTPGQRLRIEVEANRLGSPLDGVLAVLNEAGAQLANSDDQPNLIDPGLDFTAPAGTQAILLELHDLTGRGGSDFVYRISVTPLDKPNFTLTALADRYQVPKGGAAIVHVRATRQGYNGPIKLAFPGLPAGVTVAGNEIPAGATDALVTLTGGQAAPAFAVATAMGTSADPAVMPAIERPILLGDLPGSQSQPWVRGELAIALTDAQPLAVQWKPQAPESVLPLGAGLPGKVSVTRAAGAKGAVRLSLLTSQIAPQKTIKENNKDKQVDDVDRTLRLEGTPSVAADQPATIATVLVPGDLPGTPYDLALQADLLAADGKTVLASTVTPAVRLNPGPPFSVQLNAPATVEARAGSGPTGQIMGKVIRSPGFAQPVTVTLKGLPADYAAPSVVVPGDKTDFALAVSFPFGTPAAAVPGVKVIGQQQPKPGVTVSSRGVDVAVNVLPGGPPPALYKLFEDEPSFAAALNEGKGAATLETSDVYSGQAALKVTGEGRLRTKLPGLGVKIAEKPGDGEYRYIQFGWKKQGGSSILLQMNAGGSWGPAVATAGPSYRYEAGPGPNPLKAAAIKLNDKLPGDWIVITRDLFADFGAFTLDGLALTPADGEAALFDHIYLARSMDDLKGVPEQRRGAPPLAIFEDQPDFPAKLTMGAATATLFDGAKYSGTHSLKVTPDQKFNPMLPGLGVRIRQTPGPGEYRYLRFAWKKQGGQIICLQLNHDGAWGPAPNVPGKFRYDAGTLPTESYGAAIRVAPQVPAGFTVVTRDLFADFGEFTLTGLAFSPQDGEFALFDHLYLARTPADLELVAPKPAK